MPESAAISTQETMQRNSRTTSRRGLPSAAHPSRPGATEEEVRQKDVITPEDVMSLNNVTSGNN